MKASLKTWLHTLDALRAYAVSLASPHVGTANPPKVGDEAPDFTLPGTDGRDYSLSRLQGSIVVLAWFPKTFTSGCAAECRSIARGGDAIRKFADVHYFMISVDTPENSRAFATHEGADFPMLSDPSGMTARAYGVLNRAGMANRWTFYIGPDRKILIIDKHVRTSASSEDIVATLRRLGVRSTVVSGFAPRG